MQIWENGTFGSMEPAEFILEYKKKQNNNEKLSVCFYADTCCAHPCKEGLYVICIYWSWIDIKMFQDSFFEFLGIKKRQGGVRELLNANQQMGFQSEACFVFIMNHNLCNLKCFLFAAVRHKDCSYGMWIVFNHSLLQNVPLHCWKRIAGSWTSQPH